MYISVNKKTNTRRPVKYAALTSALNNATSGVWVDEDTAAQGAAKRTNRIKLTRQKPASEDYDA